MFESMGIPVCTRTGRIVQLFFVKKLPILGFVRFVGLEIGGLGKLCDRPSSILKVENTGKIRASSLRKRGSISHRGHPNRKSKPRCKRGFQEMGPRLRGDDAGKRFCPLPAFRIVNRPSLFLVLRGVPGILWRFPWGHVAFFVLGMNRYPDSENWLPRLSRREVLRLGLPLLAGALVFPADLWGAPLPVRKPKAPRVLMLDAGHGGHDPGAIGLHGLQEKDVTLDVVRRMAAALAGVPDVNVKLTRDSDDFLPLPERARLGQDAKADLFLSVHADSAPNSAARGLSAYTLSEKASDLFAGKLAEQENQAGLVPSLDLSQTDHEVAAILFDLTARRTRNTAQRAKVTFVHGVGQGWPLLEHPLRAANFAVLRAPDVPSMLIETGFLSNRSDEALLAQPAQRQKVAQLMAKEITTLLRSPLFG